MNITREQAYNWRLRLERERNKKQEKIKALTEDLELLEFQLKCLTSGSIAVKAGAIS